MLSRRLTRKGFEVLIAEDGQKGMDMTQNEHPDLVLMDMSLPVVDGWDGDPTIERGVALLEPRESPIFSVIIQRSLVVRLVKDNGIYSGCGP